MGAASGGLMGVCCVADGCGDDIHPQDYADPNVMLMQQILHAEQAGSEGRVKNSHDNLQQSALSGSNGIQDWDHDKIAKIHPSFAGACQTPSSSSCAPLMDGDTEGPFPASVRLRQRMIHAVLKDDAPVMLKLVADDAQDSLISEALWLASGQGAGTVVRELVATGVDVNCICPRTGFAPIHFAAAAGHHIACEVLLDAAADVQKEVHGCTPLALARRAGHLEAEEVIQRFMNALEVPSGPGELPADTGVSRRSQVLPRVSSVLTKAVLQVEKLQATQTVVIPSPTPGREGVVAKIDMGSPPVGPSDQADPTDGNISEHI